MALLRPLLHFLLLASLLALGFRASASGKICGQLLGQKSTTEASSREQNNQAAVGLLNELLAEGHIDSIHLKRLSEASEKSVIHNPISEEESRLNTALLIHREVFEGLIEDGLDSALLRVWVEAKLREMQTVQTERTQTSTEATSIDQEIIFKPVQAGQYKNEEAFPEPLIVPPVRVTRAFEMMTTSVTQKQFFTLMGFNPSKVFSQSRLDTRVINGDVVRLAPNHPVQNVSWFDAIDFANRLSLEHGLKPAYLIHREKGKPFKVELAEGLNSIYEAEGYRLPTQAEKELVIRRHGRAAGTYFWGDENSEFPDYAWVKENSDGHTQPVGQLKAFVVDGQQFYDLYGNVWEWTWDDFDPRMNGIDPESRTTDSARLGRGGGYHSDTIFRAHVPQNLNVLPGRSAPYVGFRLVRTIKK